MVTSGGDSYRVNECVGDDNEVMMMMVMMLELIIVYR